MLPVGTLSAKDSGGVRQIKAALNLALQNTSAVGVVLDLQSGRLLAAEHPQEAATLLSTPGSTLKPFFLADALEQNRIQAEATLFCHRNLHIGNRDLACTHPPGSGIFNAEQALAYSCNNYFATLALRFAPNDALSTLRKYSFGERTHLSSAESSGTLRLPENRDQLQLLVLGLEGILVTPDQLAEAYRHLALRFDRFPAVRRGLEESVVYGMSHKAATLGMVITGKTGTASNPGESWTHGWFEGTGTQNNERVVVVIYLPRGNGADAAMLAQQFFRSWKNQTASGIAQ